MSLKDYEDVCPFSRFIQRINKDPGLHYYSMYIDLSSVETSQRSKIEKLLILLERNYKDVGFRDEIIKKVCCNYLNYWLDKQKEIYVTPNSGINNDTWKIIESYWEGLKVHSTHICDRKIYDKSLSEKEKYIDFMVYCVNRDHLKKKCLQASDIYGYKKKYCNIFNEFTTKYYNEFTTKIPCLDNTNNDSIYTYIFSDDCTLQDMSKTFPEYDFDSESIVVGNSRKPIEKCKNTIQSVGDHKGLNFVSPSLAGDATLSKVDGTGSENSLADPESSHPGPDVYSDGPQVLDHSLSTDENLTDNGPSKPIYYAGLSVSGVFFTSMVLYKV
ncbi:hypothetical protein PVIIG_06201 [Plasmodium vivax India VII]|uniref:Uncharacterized protein n=1 Tax=Plasmodium vivax India VII TaxID=1077284 RepID=A0A0J9SHG3_PLAVI|nr:hypothetical protein PVIIG_06201 [Plasmodium vivax India VII]